jgi:hypothetical protein
MKKNGPAKNNSGIKKNTTGTKNVKASAPKKIAVSAGVITGSKLSSGTPQYPAIAKAGRVPSKTISSSRQRKAAVE